MIYINTHLPPYELLYTLPQLQYHYHNRPGVECLLPAQFLPNYYEASANNHYTFKKNNDLYEYTLTPRFPVLLPN
jgi:hypothetical protein